MGKGLKLFKVDLEELEKEKKWILEERANFDKRHAKWLEIRKNKLLNK